MKSYTLLLIVALASAQTYDIVIANGRVMDPETGLDAIRNIGIRGSRIAAITSAPLTGKTSIDAKGKVVAPGFIDLHAHGQTNEANEYQLHDGVTTALELEVGVASVEAYLNARKNNALLNYGATASHGITRTTVMPKFANLEAEARKTVLGWNELMSPGRYEPITNPEEMTKLAAGLERGLREGGLGIGMAHQYYPAASREEIFRVFEMAARWKVPIFTHVRSMEVEAMQEVISNAAATGASLHIVHVNSMSLSALPLVLEMIGAARKRGLDITTEAYPYTAASTHLESTIFDDGWQKRLGISYGDVQWEKTGERLTAETFGPYRKQGGTVIMHLMKPEWIARAMASPFVMVASDGMHYAPGAHPRSAGTFSRVLGRYVREQRVLTLMEGLKKMTIDPARRLEPIAPAMKQKGRLKVGADADITVFDPNEVYDMATFEKLIFSKGIDHVLVNGIHLIKAGQTVTGVMPGQPILGNYSSAPSVRRR